MSEKSNQYITIRSAFWAPTNTPISNLTSKPDCRNLKRPNVQPYYLDDNIMGADKLISDKRWEQEDLNSDEEVRTSKERMLTAAKNDTGEIPQTFRMTPQSTLEPVAESSKGLQLARKTFASTRSKKQLQGLYEAIPEGAAIVKTSGSTLTIKYPGQDDTVQHKSEVARFGTPAQPQIPLIQFAARKTVNNHHEKLQRTMNVHQKEQMIKLKGERTIRKRQQDSPTNSNLANLAKVHSAKVPPKRKYVQSPKKGGKKKLHRDQYASSQEEDEDDTIPAHEATADANLKDADYEPQEPIDIQEINQGKKPRRSNRLTKKPTKFGQTETLSDDDNTGEAQTSTPIKGSKGIANFQPGSSAQYNSTQGQEDERRSTSPVQGRTQEPAETEPVSPRAEEQVLEISVQSQEAREKEN